jgi:hypothetical protein
MLARTQMLSNKALVVANSHGLGALLEVKDAEGRPALAGAKVTW